MAGIDGVPEAFARQHLVAPVAFTNGALEILQANPFDVVALRVVCGHRIRDPAERLAALGEVDAVLVGLGSPDRLGAAVGESRVAGCGEAQGFLYAPALPADQLFARYRPDATSEARATG